MKINLDTVIDLLLKLDVAHEPIPVGSLADGRDLDDLRSDLRLLRAVGLIKYHTSPREVAQIKQQGRKVVALVRRQPDLLDGGRTLPDLAMAKAN